MFKGYLYLCVRYCIYKSEHDQFLTAWTFTIYTDTINEHAFTLAFSLKYVVQVFLKSVVGMPFIYQGINEEASIYKVWAHLNEYAHHRLTVCKLLNTKYANPPHYNMMYSLILSWYDIGDETAAELCDIFWDLLVLCSFSSANIQYRHKPTSPPSNIPYQSHL